MRMRFACEAFGKLFKTAVLRVYKRNVIFITVVSCADGTFSVKAVNACDNFAAVCKYVVLFIAAFKIHSAHAVRKGRIYQLITARSYAFEHRKSVSLSVFLFLNAHKFSAFSRGFPFVTGFHLAHSVTVALHPLARYALFLAVFYAVKLAFAKAVYFHFLFPLLRYIGRLFLMAFFVIYPVRSRRLHRAF